MRDYLLACQWTTLQVKTCGTKGAALCGALPSTPPVELVGEHIWGCRHFHAECHSPGRMTMLVLLFARLLPMLLLRFLQSTQPPWGRLGLFSHL